MARARGRRNALFLVAITALVAAGTASAAQGEPPRIGPVPIDFILFGLTLLGRRALPPPHAVASR